MTAFKYLSWRSYFKIWKDVLLSSWLILCVYDSSFSFRGFQNFASFWKNLSKYKKLYFSSLFFFFKVDLPLFFSFFLSKEGNKWIKTTWRYKMNLLVKSLILTNDYMKFLLRINLAQFTCTTFLPSLVILVGSYKILLHMNFARTEFILMNNLYPIFLGKLPLKLNEPFLEEKDKFGRIT